MALHIHRNQDHRSALSVNCDWLWCHVQCPGQVKFQSGQAIIFIQWQVKKYYVRLHFLEYPALFGNRTSKNLGPEAREHFMIFYPWMPMIWYSCVAARHVEKVIRTTATSRHHCDMSDDLSVVESNIKSQAFFSWLFGLPYRKVYFWALFIWNWHSTF